VHDAMLEFQEHAATEHGLTMIKKTFFMYRYTDANVKIQILHIICIKKKQCCGAGAEAANIRITFLTKLKGP
jgi:hypothetical protein